MEDCNSCRCLDGRRVCSKVPGAPCPRAFLTSPALPRSDVLVPLAWGALSFVRYLDSPCETWELVLGGEPSLPASAGHPGRRALWYNQVPPHCTVGETEA